VPFFGDVLLKRNTRPRLNARMVAADLSSFGLVCCLIFTGVSFMLLLSKMKFCFYYLAPDKFLRPDPDFNGTGTSTVGFLRRAERGMSNSHATGCNGEQLGMMELEASQ
jgi:hypothetical protein